MNTNATRTIHIARGARFIGTFENATVAPASDDPNVKGSNLDGWFTVTASSGIMFIASQAEMFATEGAARSAAKAARKPRAKRQPQRLYGDFAQLAQFNHIATDGSGRYLGK